MLRLTLLLTAVILAALLFAGEDRGQMRPGLARAVAEGRLAPAAAPAEPAAETVAEAPPPEAPIELVPAPVVGELAAAPDTATDPAPAPQLAEAETAPDEQVLEVVREPVFSLSTLPTEAIPGSDATDAVPQSGAEGEIWYVTAASVNVREGPSTNTSILGRLAEGEAALVVSDVDGQWARIIIQGDGMEGYVALRFLSPETPQL